MVVLLTGFFLSIGIWGAMSLTQVLILNYFNKRMYSRYRMSCFFPLLKIFRKSLQSAAADKTPQAFVYQLQQFIIEQSYFHNPFCTISPLEWIWSHCFKCLFTRVLSINATICINSSSSLAEYSWIVVRNINQSGSSLLTLRWPSGLKSRTVSSPASESLAMWWWSRLILLQKSRTLTLWWTRWLLTIKTGTSTKYSPGTLASGRDYL